MKEKKSEMKQFLYKIQVVRPAMLTEGPTPEEAQAVSEHFIFLERLTAEGILLLAGRTQNSDFSAFGIAIFRAESEEAARKLMAEDPVVQRRVMRAEIYPYRIALLGDATPFAP
jgi:uncharacterized protein YciI